MVKVLCLSVAVLSLSVTCAFSQAAQGDYTAAPQTDWTKDLSTKMDTAIRLLNVIKQEMDEESKLKAAKPTAPGQQDLGAQVKEKTSFFVRLWRRIRQALAPQGQAPGTAGEAGDWTESLESNVDLLVNVGEKVHKIMAEHSTKARATGVYTPAWDEDMKDKIDRTIKVLDAVREGLEEKEKMDSDKAPAK